MKKSITFILFFLVIPFQFTIAQIENNVKDQETKYEDDESIEKHQILKDRFHFEIGMFIPAKEINIGAHGTSPDEEFDFGDTFRLNDNESTLFLHIEWYFTKKWKLSIENFSIKNANTIKLEEDIVWEELVFKEGSNVKGGFGINLYRVFVGRTFSNSLKHEFGAGLGVHALDANAFIEGQVIINETDIKFERRSVSAIIPLPNIGLWYYYAPNTKWAFIARVDWFSLTINEYSGSLYDISPGVKYQFFKNFGLGIDYRYFYLKANVNEDNWDGKFNMGFKGPLISLHANF